MSLAVYYSLLADRDLRAKTSGGDGTSVGGIFTMGLVMVEFAGHRCHYEDEVRKNTRS